MSEAYNVKAAANEKEYPNIVEVAVGSHLEAHTIARSQSFRLTLSPAPVYGTDGMEDVSGGKAPGARRDSISRSAVTCVRADFIQFAHDRRPGSPVDRPIHTAASGKT